MGEMLYQNPGPCTWLVECASGNPEPDCYEDTIAIIDCGAPRTALRENGSDGWTCEAGHHHWEYGSPMQQAEERDEAMAERMGEHHYG